MTRIRAVDVTSAGDLDDALAVISTCELQGIGWTDATRESVESLLAGPDSLAEAHLLAFVGDNPVGVLAAEIDRHGHEIFLDAFAIGDSPALLQRDLLERGIVVAESIAAEDPTPVWQVISAAYEQDDDYRDVLTGLGMRPVRRFWRMIWDLTGRTADPAPAPPRVSRRVVDGDADRRLMHALFRESFAEHFGSSHDRPFDDWIATVEGLAGADPTRWWLAFLDDQPVGICLLDDSKAEFGEGYVRTLGVLPEARGRGIAKWLLECAAADSVARGRSGLALSVDGENTTGATALYASVGFTTRQVIDVWCLPLVADARQS